MATISFGGQTTPSEEYPRRPPTFTAPRVPPTSDWSPAPRTPMTPTTPWTNPTTPGGGSVRPGPTMPRVVPTAPTITPRATFQGLNQNAILEYLRGLGAPSTAALRSGFQGMLDRGLLPAGSYLENAQDADEIFIPGYGWLDVMIGADTGMPSDWQYLMTGMGGMGGFGNYWNDPMLQQYTDFGMQAMQRLMQPTEINPVLQDALSKLNAMFGAQNAGYEQFKGLANRRLSQLQQPLFAMGGTTGSQAPQQTGAATPELAWVPQDHPLYGTPGYVGSLPSDGAQGATTGASTDGPDAMLNSALLRTKFVEPLMQQRDAAQQRALERASARGLGMTSGLTEELARGVDSQFDRQLSEGYRDLMLYEVNANEEREKEAIAIGQLLSSLANSTLPVQLSAAGQMANIGQGLQGEELRNMMAALGISQGLAQMPLQQMMAVGSMTNMLGNQQVPNANPTASLMQLLLSMAGLGENVYNNAAGQEGNFWQAIFQALPGIINDLNKKKNENGGGQ